MRRRRIDQHLLGEAYAATRNAGLHIGKLRPIRLIIRRTGLCTIALCAIAHAATAAEQDQADTAIETLTVYGERISPLAESEVTSHRIHHGGADTARLVALMPGADVNDNGPISGQIQYRGLSGPRMDVKVNGMRIVPGGPNWMDPPLHYVPPGLLHSVKLQRGAAGVTSGNVGAQASAQWKRPEYDAGPYLDIDTSYRSVDDGSSIAATTGFSTSQHRVYVSVSDETGDDYTPGDSSSSASQEDIVNTGFDRGAYGAGYGFRGDSQSFDAGYYRINSDDAGTPSLPLDVEFFATTLWHGTYQIDLGQHKLTIMAGGSDIDHRMNNYTMRPPPDFSNLPLPPFQGTDRRMVNADSESRELRVSYEMPIGSGIALVGIDIEEQAHAATVLDPDFAPFFVDNFVDSRVTGNSVYAQWEDSLSDVDVLKIGIRGTKNQTDTDAVDAFPARLVDMNPDMWPLGTPPRAVWALRERFNASQRDQSDSWLDAIVEWTHTFNQALSATASLARKHRAPLYIERYLWIPLEVNAGLGDGNNYVGDPNLEPEQADQIELGLNWTSSRGYLAPRIAYNRIDDYIQGIASSDPVTIAVSTNANGDPTPLQFANVDAEIFSFDVSFGYELTDQWRIDGNAAYLRGKRRDVSDNLYRLSPANLRVGLSWQEGPWRATIEEQLVAKQGYVSDTLTDDPLNPNNNNDGSSGFALTHLYGQYTTDTGIAVTLGIENLFDRAHEDPLSGFNRNSASSVARGQRLPGRGRNAFVRLHYQM